MRLEHAVVNQEVDEKSKKKMIDMNRMIRTRQAHIVGDAANGSLAHLARDPIRAMVARRYRGRPKPAWISALARSDEEEESAPSEPALESHADTAANEELHEPEVPLIQHPCSSLTPQLDNPRVNRPTTSSGRVHSQADYSTPPQIIRSTHDLSKIFDPLITQDDIARLSSDLRVLRDEHKSALRFREEAAVRHWRWTVQLSDALRGRSQ